MEIATDGQIQASRALPEEPPSEATAERGQLEMRFDDAKRRALQAVAPGGDEAGPALALPTHLGEILARLEADPSRVRRHVEMKSAIRKMGEAIRLPLPQIPADPQLLRELVRAVAPAAAGLSKERWSRLRSLVSASLRDMGCDLQPGRDIAGHSQAWKALAKSLPNRSQNLGLSRFMSFCTRLGIEPEQVTATTFDEFGEALQRRSLCNKPDAIQRTAIRHWNRAVKEVPRWPQIEARLVPHPRYYSFGWDDFPASFRADVEAFLAQKGSDDAFDETYVRAVRPATIELRRRQLRQLASHLALGGVPIDRITHLAVLANADNATIALKHELARNDSVNGVTASQHAWLLKIIAEHWVEDLDSAKRLTVIAKRLGTRPKGMTERNRQRLRQFDHKANVQALLQLTRRVFSDARRDKLNTIAEARRVMLALAVDILLVAPMRVGNLCTLELDRHFVVIGRGNQKNRHIIIPALEMKTGEMFEVIVPPGTSDLIDLYIERYRPRLHTEPTQFLFPALGDGHRSKTSFSITLSKFIKRETGIIMHAHLFRHLAGKLHLNAHPTDLETVRRVLQHASSATTLRYYAEHRTSQAFAIYDDTIEQLRNPPPADPRAGPRAGASR